jgi:ATP-dependent Clp protease ATP-binding subunit ClpC
MPDKFAIYNDYARRVLTLAQEESMRMNHSYIGSEHILLGLIRDEGRAGQILHELNVILSETRSTIERTIGRGEPLESGTIITLTPRAKKILNLTSEEARNRNHDYIGSEHLLVALLVEGEGIGDGILQGKNITLEQIVNKAFGTA